METKYEKRWRRRFSFKLLFLWCYFSVNRGIGGFIHHGVVCQTFQKRCMGLSVCVFVCVCVCVCVCLCVQSPCLCLGSFIQHRAFMPSLFPSKGTLVRTNT